MTKNLTRKITQEDIPKKEVIFKSREYDFSSEESKKRIKRIQEQQKVIKKSIIYTQSDLEKIYFPRFGPKHY